MAGLAPWLLSSPAVTVRLAPGNRGRRKARGAESEAPVRIHGPPARLSRSHLVKKTRQNEGFTLIELLIVVAIIGIIAAIAVPGLLRARMSGNEASAIGSLRAINTAQQNFAQFCNGYATNLQELRVAGNFLSPDLTQGAGGTA